MNTCSPKFHNTKCDDGKSTDYQNISKNLISNISLGKLEKKIKKYSDDTIYFYIVTTVKYDEEKNIFRQAGIGPNLEGGFVSLCTCKHYMRTFPGIQKGTWVAGVTGVSSGPDYGDKGIKGNYLFYLFQIDKTFESHYDFYNYIKKSDEIFNSKSSLHSRFGDAYIPTKDLKGEEKYEPAFYKKPIEGHRHFKKESWHYDIKKVTRNFRGNVIETNHKLLLGGEKNNFVWEKPMIKLAAGNRIGEGQRTSTIKEFLKLFRD
jgi:hypothetical protein